MDLISALHWQHLLCLDKALQVARLIRMVVLGYLIYYPRELLRIGVMCVVLKVELDLLYGLGEHELMLPVR